MCGIAGIINFKNHGNVRKENLIKMSDSLVHRGPDDSGLYINKHIGLAHRRLSIIDINSGIQPMKSGSSTIIYNGEIYNFRKLKNNLENNRINFNTESDTEVLLSGIQKHGPEFLNDVNGMFSFCYHDSKKNLTYLAIDRFGIKPLYYARTISGLIFASEIKAITAIIGKDDIDENSIPYHINLGYIPAPRTIYRHIKRLEPGQLIEIQNNELRIISWYNRLERIETPDNYSETQALLRRALEDSVKMRMISDVPLGAFLSGGVDSTIICSLMAKNSRRKIKTFSIGFDYPEYDETVFAEEVAKKIGSEHKTIIVGRNMVDKINTLISRFDQPYGDSSMIPTFAVSALAKNDVTVSLSGDGGDELFGGYNRYAHHLRDIRLRDLPLPWDKIFDRTRKISPTFKYNNILSKLSKNNCDGYCERQMIFSPLMQESLFDTNYGRDLQLDLPLNYLRNAYRSSGRNFELARAMECDFLTYMVQDVLTKVDIMSMTSSLEVRVPFLDHRVVQLALSLPEKWIMRNGLKSFLKSAFSEYLPDSVNTRKKMGFGVPLDKWFRKELKKEGEELILKNPPPSMNIYFNHDFLKKLWSEHQKGKSDHSYRLYHVYSLFLWARENYWS